MRKHIEIKVRIASKIEEGYFVYSRNEALRIIEGMQSEEGKCSNIELVDPCNNAKLQIIHDDMYSVLKIYKDVCAEIGIEYHLSPERDRLCPAGIDMLLLINDSYLIEIDDYSIPFNRLCRNFDATTIIIYLLPIFGKGEICRENGIKMSIRPEKGEKHKGPHIHIEGGDNRSASIRIDDTEEGYKGNLNKKELKQAKKIINENKKTLLEMWKLQMEGISIKANYNLGMISFTVI